MSLKLVELPQRCEPNLRIEEWVLAAQAGKVQAFEKLFIHFKARIFALCLRMSGNSAIAEELTQEAFFLAWKNLAGFKGDSQFGTWLHRIASNTVISFFRKRILPVDDSTCPEQSESHSQTPTPDIARDLEQAIARLPDKARMVLVLYEIEGYTHEEIAQTMGIAAGTCKAQLHRARNLLQERLSSHER